MASKARTSYGRELCRDMAPVCDIDHVAKELSCAGQAMEHILRFGMLPLGGRRDLREALTYAKAGGTLTCSFEEAVEKLKSVLPEYKEKLNQAE